MAEAKPEIDPGYIGSSRAEEPREPSRIYQDLRDLLDQRGWVQGRNSKGHLTLDAAVDELLRTRPGDPATGAELARAARITAHLRELSGAANLVAWNDAAERRLDDVHQLLVLAGWAYPTD